VLCRGHGSLTFTPGRSRIFDYPRRAKPLREALRANGERLATQNGLEIAFIRCPKEDKIHEVLASATPTGAWSMFSPGWSRVPPIGLGCSGGSGSGVANPACVNDESSLPTTQTKLCL
jgi:hypothetical protein